MSPVSKYVFTLESMQVEPPPKAVWPLPPYVSKELVGNCLCKARAQAYGVAGSNRVPMIKMGAVVLLVAALGGFVSWANQREHGALLQDIDFAISGMGAFLAHC